MDQILAGLSDIYTLHNITYIAFGIILGTAVGALPGLGPVKTVAVATPLTFFMPPLTAICFLIGILKGGYFGGSISSILLNTPGTAEAAATCFDGYPLAKKGKPEKALKMALYASVFGDTLSDIVLIVVAAPIALLALKMGPPEITSLILLSLTIIAAFTSKSVLKGWIAAGLGMFLTTVGMDIVVGKPRLTFGFLELEDGIPMIPFFIGVLALSEILIQMEDRKAGGEKALPLNREASKEDRRVSLSEFKKNIVNLLRSTAIGTVVGALPGMGSTIAAFLSYAAAKRSSKNPEKFGQGSLEGIAAAEAGNSATCGANLIPTFTLGIPGNLAAALLIGAFIIHGVAPGPLMFQEHGRLIYGIYGGMILANGLNLVIGFFGLRFFAKLLRIKKQLLYPMIILLCITGVYMVDRSLFDVAIMIAFGCVGYFMKKLDFSFVTFIIGFVLGPILEISLRQTLIISQNDPMILVKRPISMALLFLTIISIWWFGISRQKKNK